MVAVVEVRGRLVDAISAVVERQVVVDAMDDGLAILRLDPQRPVPGRPGQVVQITMPPDIAWRAAVRLAVEVPRDFFLDGFVHGAGKARRGVAPATEVGPVLVAW